MFEFSQGTMIYLCFLRFVGTRFFATICSAPKSSCLHSFENSPLMPLQPPIVTTDSTENPTSIDNSIHYFQPSSRSLTRSANTGDGFLHATVDRLLFVISCNSGGCRQELPALKASWNFNNGDIRIYGTGRLATSQNFFYLSSGRGADGRYVFICEKAANLAAWVQRATRPASYLYEWRWLSSVATQIGEEQTMLLMQRDCVDDFNGEQAASPQYGQTRRVHGISRSESTKVTVAIDYGVGPLGFCLFAYTNVFQCTEF